MSEQAPLPEHLSKPGPILQLALEMGIPFSDKSDEILTQFKPGMDAQTKVETLDSLYLELQNIIDKHTTIDTFYQLCHKLGMVLTVAHAHYQTGSVDDVFVELEDARLMSDQNSATKPAFNIITHRIDLLMEELEQELEQP